MAGSLPINLGIQPLGIPNVLGEAPDPKKITESECELRRRLSETGTDQWWQHDSTQDGMDAAVVAATDVYLRLGRPMLVLLGGADSPIFSITPEQTPSFRDCFRGFGSTDARIALVLARLRKAQGRLMEARAFAAYGLNHMGRAASFRSELEALCQIE